MMDHGRDKSLSPEVMRLSKLLLQNPASRLFVPLAETYLKSGMRDEALLILNEGIRHHPTFIAALVMLGKIYFKMGGRDKAKNLFEQALKINSENIPSLKNMGAIYQEEGHLQQALETYRTILMIDPSDRAAKRLFVALEAETSAKTELEPTAAHFDDAGHSLSTEVEAKQEEIAEPNDPETLPRTPQARDLGANDSGDRNDKAEETLETLTLASVYMSQGCYQEAADIYNKLLARNPDNSESRIGLEKALSRLSESSEQTITPPASSRREREIARLEGWLHVVQTKGRG